MKRLFVPAPTQVRTCGLAFAFMLLLGAQPLSASNVLLDDSLSLRLPQVGDHQLRLVSSNLLELMLITTTPLTQWNFVDASGNLTLPAASEFTVLTNGQTASIQSVSSFKRRPLYAGYSTYDLRLANYLYLQLSRPVADGTFIQVLNPSTHLWATNVLFTLTVSPLRYSPALHVNQVGYVSGLTWPKEAFVGYYLGMTNELAIPTNRGFQLISTATSNTVFTGSLLRVPDSGFTYSPTPYQQVYKADFADFTTPGQYKLLVPGLGTSLPFLIHDGVAATLARAYELGIYHQRCGTNNALPYTRFVHGACHTNLAQVPTMASPEFDFANSILNQDALTNPVAPRMVNVAASLFPFVNTNDVNISGGHHDAGDYSKYTINVSTFIHYLMFAVDAFPGVGSLDNLGIPESGDGISDLMQEAKWEADFLAKMQDADGGFYFNVYPKNRQYEVDVLPDHGDPQIVMPKNTAATAAAVAALAEIGSSPAFKAVYPTVATNYLAKALTGWKFLTNAFVRFGRTGAYQSESYLGNDFIHNDELAWAAAALYAATTNAAFQTDLTNNTPNPNDPNLRKWGWWSMWGPYGCAYRDYAFAARTGRLPASALSSSYLARCVAEIQLAGSNALAWSYHTSYGSSFPDDSKGTLLTGWYFSGEKTFDLAVANAITNQFANLDVILRNFNYELGGNPVNITFLTGLGSKRQRNIVDQYAENDYRVLPPSGIPIGNIQQGFDWTSLYGTELGNLCYPLDGAQPPYPMYDRWGDAWNGPTEFIVGQQSVASLATAAWLMAMTNLRTQAWNSAVATISGVPAKVPQNQGLSANLVAPGLDLSQATIVWEGLNQEPFLGPSFAFTPGNIGTNWVEVEAQLPDGRRVYAATNFFAVPSNAPPVLVTNADMVAYYPLSTDFADATHQQPNLTPTGVGFDNIGLRVQAHGNYVSVNLPNSALANSQTLSISVEASFYLNQFLSPDNVVSNFVLVLSKNSNAQLLAYQQSWNPQPDIFGDSQIILPGSTLTNYLTPGQWHLFNLAITRTGYVVCVDGIPIFTNTSGDLVYWPGSGSVVLRAGEFDGWLRNLVVRNVQPPRLTGMAELANGNFQFFFGGAAGLSYTAWGSTNFTNWTMLGPATLSGPNTFQFLDTLANRYQTRFYRVSVP